MGINIDEGYLGVGMSLNVTGLFSISFPGPERQRYRNWHWKDTMTLVRSAHTFKWGYEGQYVNFDLIRGNGSRSANFTGARSGSAMADFLLGAFDNVEPWIRRGRQLSAAVEAPVFHPGRMEADAAHHDERGCALRAVVPVGAGVRPLHVLGIRHAVDRQARCAARHSVSRRSERARQDGRGRHEQLRAARRRRVGRQWQTAEPSSRVGYGIYYNHISGTSVHAAEAPWTGTVQLFNGRIDDPFGSLNRTVPPSGVPISGEFGCVTTSAYPGLNCPLYPLPLNFVYNDLEMATPTVQHVNVSFQRQLTNDFMVDVAYVGRFGTKLEGHRHFNPAQFINSPRTGAAPTTGKHQRARRVRAGDHRSHVPRAGDAVRELVSTASR